MKNERQAKILELIKNIVITSQQDLQEALEKKGFRVAQPTLSRDIKELGLVKILDGNGNYKYSVQNQDRQTTGIISYFVESVLSVGNAQNLVIIKCKTGMAQATCAALDDMELDLIVGTIAGEDTIFIATKSENDALKLCEELSKKII